MKKKIIALTLSILCITCVNSNIYASNNVPAKNSKKTVQKVKTENRYDIAGVTNVTEFEKSFNIVKVLVKKNDKVKVANYVNYPLNVNTETKKIKIRTKQQFIKNYNTIITANVKKALLNQDVTKTFVNYQGVMVGDGEIWFTSVKNKAMIKAVNIFDKTYKNK